MQSNDPEGCWRALVILAVALLLAMTTWFSATAVVPQLAERWQLSTAQIAWLTIGVQLGFVAGAVAVAIFAVADRVPSRRLMLIGAVGATIFNGLLLFASDGSEAIILRFMTGVFLAGVYPPAMKVMATWFRHRRGTALGVMVGALTLGSAAPHLINGLGGLNWQIVIIVTSSLTLLGGLIAEYMGADGPYAFPKARFQLRLAWKACSDHKVLLASAGYFGHMWELYAMWAWFSVFLGSTLPLRDHAQAAQWVSLGTFVVIGIGCLGCWLGGLISDRRGRIFATVMSLLISGSCALIIGFLQYVSVGLVFAIGIVWGFWVVADSAQFSAIVTEVAHQSYVGTALTLQLALGFVLTVPTIWLIPVIQQRAGWGSAMAFLSIGPLCGALAMHRLGAMLRRESAAV